MRLFRLASSFESYYITYVMINHPESCSINCTAHNHYMIYILAVP